MGYVIGIALFIVLLPVIAIYGLFGWMSGGEVAEIIGYDVVYQNLPTEIREQIDENEIQLDTIETVFRENGLASGDISKAKLIYLSYLTDRYSEENFYQRLADCFLTVREDSDLLTNISSAFGLEFSDADRNNSTNILEVYNNQTKQDLNAKKMDRCSGISNRSLETIDSTQWEYFSKHLLDDYDFISKHEGNLM